MANNYSQATVLPYLPAALFSQTELEALAYACGLRCEPYGDHLYFFADECFCEEGEDEHGQRINCLELLEAKLQSLDPAAYAHIAIEGAATCSKMRSGEFGGFAYLVTRQEVRSMSTWQWLSQQAANACQGIPTEALEQGAVAGLRHALEALLDAAGDLDAAIDGVTDQFDDERARLDAAHRKASAALARAASDRRPA